MRNILHFILSNGTVIYFIVLELISVLLIVNFNDYHRSGFLSSSNALCGSVYSMQRGISQYFSLREENEVLLEEVLRLRMANERLERELSLIPDSLIDKEVEVSNTYRMAKVINITTNRQYNYLTLDKGEGDGISREMTVTSGGSVVGIVIATSSHFSTVMPIINGDFRLSVKLQGSNFRGQLMWDNRSAREGTIIDIPEHASVSVGDSVVTSGSSSYFREGVLVGIIKEVDMDRNGGFYRLTVGLATDFYSIYNVEIEENMQREEQLELEGLRDE